jgi:hypothetical protein
VAQTETASGTTPETDPLYEEVRAFVDEPASEPVPAWDPVNQPMIRHWCDAMGDELPVYTDTDAARAAGHPDVVAPPAALQMWTMPGLRLRGAEDPSTRARARLAEATPRWSPPTAGRPTTATSPSATTSAR